MNPLHEGLIQERVPEPHVMVIFGAGGDLSKRKLIPALYTLARERLLPGGFAMLGTANRDMNDKAFRQEMKESCDRFARRRPGDVRQAPSRRPRRGDPVPVPAGGDLPRPIAGTRRRSGHSELAR